MLTIAKASRTLAVVAALVTGAGVGYTFYAQHEKERKAAAPKHTYAELQPLLENRCFRTKTADEQKEWMHRIDVLPKADFKKTIDDLDAINAADRLLGTQGCEAPK